MESKEFDLLSCRIKRKSRPDKELESSWLRLKLTPRLPSKRKSSSSKKKGSLSLEELKELEMLKLCSIKDRARRCRELRVIQREAQRIIEECWKLQIATSRYWDNE